MVFRFKNKEKKEPQKTTTNSFVLGVMDVFALKNAEDMVVVGKVKGTVNTGMAVYVTNFGDDNGSTILSTIIGIEINQKSVNTATDCFVGLKIEAGKKHNMKIGTVIYTRDISIGEVHDAYISAIGDSYVLRKDIDLSDDEIETMSITDCAEAWRLFRWCKSKTNQNESEEQKKENYKKLTKLAEGIRKKLFEAEEIYVVYNKRTGEPHMFSATSKREDDSYCCSPPDIMLVTKAYKNQYETIYSKDNFELLKVENGEKKEGIYNFLGTAFYLNGACGIRIHSVEVTIDAAALIPKPDYSNVPEINIPVTNPDLVRWMLLMGQMGQPETHDAEIIHSLYYRFMSIEMIKATFVIPMKAEGKLQKNEESEKVVLEKDTHVSFPTRKGKADRDSVLMYTDWKRLREEFGPEWSGLLQPISGMIDLFDCAINATGNIAAGCYIDKENYEDMKKWQ